MRLIDADAISLEGTISDVVEEILNAPTIDAESVVYGEWSYDPFYRGMARGVVICSQCESAFDGSAGFNFCPSCGAKMRGDTK